MAVRPPRYSPMLLSTGPPPESSSDWVVEAKWDGMRAVLEGGPDGWQGWSRRGTSITSWFPELERVVQAVDGRRVVLDGEVIALGAHGGPSFVELQRRIGRVPRSGVRDLPQVHFVAFDLLWVDGRDLSRDPWHERRNGLEELGRDGLTLSPVYDDAGALRSATEALGLEGCVHKRRDAAYVEGPRRCGAWRKQKATLTTELTVGGLAWTARSRSLPALLVGTPRTDGQLEYRGCVEASLASADRAALVETLLRCRVGSSPFGDTPRFRQVCWVVPALRVEVRHCRGDGALLRDPVLVRAVRVAALPD